MTKQSVLQKLPWVIALLQAAHEGKTIQYKTLDEKWKDLVLSEQSCVPSFESPQDRYRIKPEPQVCWLLTYEFRVNEKSEWIQIGVLYAGKGDADAAYASRTSAQNSPGYYRNVRLVTMVEESEAS